MAVSGNAGLASSSSSRKSMTNSGVKKQVGTASPVVLAASVGLVRTFAAARRPVPPVAVMCAALVDAVVMVAGACAALGVWQPPHMSRRARSVDRHSDGSVGRTRAILMALRMLQQCVRAPTSVACSVRAANTTVSCAAKLASHGVCTAIR